ARFLCFLSSGSCTRFNFLISKSNSLQKSSTVQNISITLSFENMGDLLVKYLNFNNLNILTFSLFSYLFISTLIPNSRFVNPSLTLTQLGKSSLHFGDPILEVLLQACPRHIHTWCQRWFIIDDHTTELLY